MGFDIQNTRFILDANKSGVNFSRCATLGRQNLHIDKKTYAEEALRFGLDSAASAVNSAFSSFPYADGFLYLMGAKELTTIDASNYEGASVIVDLNTPIPNDLVDRFSVVIDGGTIEHIFNVPCAFSNVAKMLKQGGHFISVNGANNFMGHGFYQFSPELLYRTFSMENGFQVESMIICEHTRNSDWYEVADPAKVGARVELINNSRTYIMMRARKVASKELFVNTPQQSDYAGIEWQGAQSGASELSYLGQIRRNRIREWLPIPVRTAARRLRQATRRHFQSPYFSKVRTF